MVTTLYLLRHGATEGSEVRRYKGWLDVPLSLKGLKQMERASEFIKTSFKDSGPLRAVYSSDLIRAVRSAQTIAGQNGLLPIVMPELRERNFGLWEGLSFDEIKESSPEEFKAWADDPLRFSPPAGESTMELRDRAVRALEEILKMHTDGAIAVVSHGGVNRVVLCEFLGIPLENIFRLEQDYGAVNIIEFHDGLPVLKLLNGVAG